MEVGIEAVGHRLLTEGAPTRAGWLHDRSVPFDPQRPLVSVNYGPVAATPALPDHGGRAILTAMTIAATADAVLDTPLALSAGPIAAYRRDGCVRLPGVLPAEILPTWKSCFAALVAANRPALPPMAERSTYHQAFLQVINLWRGDAAARRFVLARRLASIARQLLGAPGVRIYHDQALFKEAGGGHTPWHYDAHYWPLDGARTVTAWVPLQAVPSAMGPLAFALGSARLARHESDLDIDISDDSERLAAQRLADLPYDVQPYAAGDVSFHSGECFHRADGNHTDGMRAVMTVIYHASDARVVAPRNRAQGRDIEQWLPGCQPGDVAATEMNPLVDGI